MEILNVLGWNLIPFSLYEESLILSRVFFEINDIELSYEWVDSYFQTFGLSLLLEDKYVGLNFLGKVFTNIFSFLDILNEVNLTKNFIEFIIGLKNSNINLVRSIHLIESVTNIE